MDHHTHAPAVCICAKMQDVVCCDWCLGGTDEREELGLACKEPRLVLALVKSQLGAPLSPPPVAPHVLLLALLCALVSGRNPVDAMESFRLVTMVIGGPTTGEHACMHMENCRTPQWPLPYLFPFSLLRTRHGFFFCFCSRLVCVVSIADHLHPRRMQARLASNRPDQPTSTVGWLQLHWQVITKRRASSSPCLSISLLFFWIYSFPSNFHWSV